MIFHYFVQLGNVVAVHCKAGKGRTGTLIAAYLMFSGLVDTAEEALNVFATQRSRIGKGVTNPCQLRYVHYFGRLLGGELPMKQKLRFEQLSFLSVPQMDASDGGCRAYVEVYSGFDDLIFSSKDQMNDVGCVTVGVCVFPRACIAYDSKCLDGMRVNVTRIHTHVYTYTHTQTQTQTHTHTHTHTYTFVRVHVHVHAEKRVRLI